jgi:benzoyl-CoA reductase/2-hydroxyglutaryl-CoA dehydratase subunit BcrC/BadD/HgdB
MVVTRELRRQRLAEVEQLKRGGRKVVGYLCIYAPVELIHAAGAIPVRLEHGSHEAELAGGKYLRADACSFCKSCLGGFELDPLYRMTDAVVAVNTCDMMRRLPESIERYFGKPVLQVFLPRTSEVLPHRVAEFRRQLDWLRAELGRLTGTQPADAAVQKSIAVHNCVRGLLRTLDKLRADDAPGMSASRLLDLVALAWLLDPEQAAEALKAAGGERSASRPARPRLMVGGSLLAEDDHWLIELVEQRADIVADFLCTGSRSFAEDVAETQDPVQGLAEFYYSRIPCMQRRPNDALYNYVRELAGARRVAGILYKTLLYCDPWNFEAKRLKTALGLPLLHLDTDYSKENREQVRTRVEAFLEML